MPRQDKDLRRCRSHTSVLFPLCVIRGNLDAFESSISSQFKYAINPIACGGLPLVDKFNFRAIFATLEIFARHADDLNSEEYSVHRLSIVISDK